ncbi:hypothetical protein PTTG_02684 [Puccinia triticina 1-1 BBBD Race 1]|uniref:UDP-N-acetylglucosamine transferase subunit ALG13 n=1 Tax=Puccinia triticina (isolate 1-1 / race 1 (BBBD)) TaxID=630390 RepID=A0A0C4EPI2_PUCT1|nr:hypothetical protein PTTG_02684 [Puccinia triticina 1-1 BBBD Race 1]WAR51728.1 hypothetical protein PtB15_1B164 [Puccinia triticina]
MEDIVVVTVGSTRFDQLINTLLAPSHAELAGLLGRTPTLTRVLVQIGSQQELTLEGQAIPIASHLSLPPSQHIQLTIFRYSDAIDSLLSRARLIITHAGAGSILSAIRPITPAPELQAKLQVTPDLSLDISPTSIKNDKPIVIIVPNPGLMDNHQLDLAHQISSLGLAYTCSTDQLLATIKEALNPHHQSSSNSSELDLDPVPGPTKFRNLLDQQMGFNNE